MARPWKLPAAKLTLNFSMADRSHSMGDRPPHIAFPFDVLVNATNKVVTIEDAKGLADIVARCIN